MRYYNGIANKIYVRSIKVVLMRAKESREMYLEVILTLEKRNGVVRSIDIANELGYSKPSVSRAMRVLGETGDIIHTAYGDITLTEQGRKKAQRIYQSHQLLTDFLTTALGLSPDVAESDACRIEHVISDEALDAIEKYMEHNT
jgi:Mn-dependent DtxR family transcriptional regulator